MRSSFFSGLIGCATRLVAVAVFCGAICAGPAARASGDSVQRGRIVVLGDSLTSGYGLDDPATQAYPALLQRRIDAAGLPWTVVNAGVSGDTTAGGLRRVNWALQGGADILVVALGGNDGLRGSDPRQTSENLAGIIREARSRNPRMVVLLAGMRMPDNMGADYVKRFSAVYPDVAKAHQATLIPFLLEGVGGDPKLNQADRIHPTAAGQEKIADTVWKTLRPVLEKAQAARGNGTGGT